MDRLGQPGRRLREQTAIVPIQTSKLGERTINVLCDVTLYIRRTPKEVKHSLVKK